MPVRLHSACLTGDLFGSLKCDCGDQLRRAVAMLSKAGGGVLLYLDQEGRGIGLRNKMRAYGLQDLGHDTLEADAALGYGPDERRYLIAGRMLNLLGIGRVLLLTNSPSKIAASNRPASRSSATGACSAASTVTTGAIWKPRRAPAICSAT